jgi:2-amino-4-hydroxy-6-hydroxymethyldihydropteridine diphosphokinase
VPLCFVSIGSNIDREQNVRGALQALHEAFGPLLISSIRETAAVGFVGDPFHNLAAGFFSELPAHDVIKTLSGIEQRHGRTRGGERFGARTLDIDLLLYGEKIDAELKLPRAEITQHAFVLEPLAEIAPALKHPREHRSFAELWRELKRR